MASVDFKALRMLIGMAQVLKLLDFQVLETSGSHVRGACPLHASSSARGRTFSANLQKNAYRCFKCGARGNQLDLWAAATRQPLHAAAVDLCNRMQITVPETAVRSNGLSKPNNANREEEPVRKR